APVALPGGRVPAIAPAPAPSPVGGAARASSGPILSRRTPLRRGTFAGSNRPRRRGGRAVGRRSSRPADRTRRRSRASRASGGLSGARAGHRRCRPAGGVYYGTEESRSINAEKHAVQKKNGSRKEAQKAHK